MSQYCNSHVTTQMCSHLWRSYRQYGRCSLSQKSESHGGLFSRKFTLNRISPNESTVLGLCTQLMEDVSAERGCFTIAQPRRPRISFEMAMSIIMRDMIAHQWHPYVRNPQNLKTQMIVHTVSARVMIDLAPPALASQRGMTDLLWFVRIHSYL
jgi:hypothetical protein